MNTLIETEIDNNDKIVIIQINISDGFPYNEDTFQAYLGFCELNYKIVFKTYEQIMTCRSISEVLGDNIDYKIACCVGNINFTKIITRLCNKIFPQPMIDYPNELIQYRGREINIKSMEQLDKIISLAIFLNNIDSKFIKPVKMKQFHSQVIDSKESYETFKSINQGMYIDSDLCYVSEYVEIVSEWRNYVIDSILIDSKCYDGDFKIHPDYQIVEQMIKNYIKSPVAYGLDIGITKNGQIILIEVNHMTTLGNYGISYLEYSKMLLKSWNQLPIKE